MSLEIDKNKLSLQALRRVIVTLEQQTQQTFAWAAAVEKLREAHSTFESELFFSEVDAIARTGPPRDNGD